MTWIVLRRLRCRPFRTCCLGILAVVFVCQSLFVLYLLTKVNDTESPTEMGISYHQQPAQAANVTCSSLGKTALSAINRATSGKCKAELRQVACSLKNGELVPERFPNFCPRKGSKAGSSLGCFADSGQPRLLASYGLKLQQLTIQRCIDVCLQSSFPYAGVHNGKECYCGTERPSPDQLLTTAYCGVPCSGLPAQTCGGFDATEVFDTGVPTRDSPALRASAPSSNTSSSRTRIAFILTLNGRALRQVTRLLRIIYRPHHVYLIHVDARQDYLFRNLLPLELSHSNIRLTRKRQSSIWGGASLLDVLLRAMEQLLELDAHWQYVFNLSESDFPLRTVEELEALLASNLGRNFLKSHGRQTRQFIHKQGLDRVFHECESRMWRLGDRNLPSGIRIDGGSDWFGITRELAQYATRGVADSEEDQLLKGLKKVYKYTLLPAESFFHVLVLNTKFCGSYADNNLRMTLWRRSQGCLCQHRHVVDWCGCSPMVFRTGDWSHIQSVMAKSVVFFARKFEAAVDQSVINRLEEQLANTSINLAGWDNYWESVFHAADVTPKPSDALLAVCAKLAAHSLSLLTQTSELHALGGCSLQPSRIVAVTSHFRLDHYQGDLILFEADEGSQFEALVKPLSKTTYYTHSNGVRITNFQVSSDYDPKEQVLRNRLAALSAGSKPVAVAKWTGPANASTETAQFVWYDPHDQLRAVHQINISDSAKMVFQMLELDDGLTPGVWTVVAVHERKILASSEFLIVPLVDAPLAHESPVHLSQRVGESFLPNDAQSLSKRRRRAEKIKSDPEAFLVEVTAEFYAVQNVCVVVVPSVVQCKSVAVLADWQSCNSSEWSSLAPDPKSHFA